MARIRKHYDAEGNYTGQTVKQHGCLSALGWIIAITSAVAVVVWAFESLVHAFQ
jgi:hypothetical protein